jgi:uncharacterized membrane protein
MSPTDMPEDAETYLRQLERDLARMPADERGKIVQEIRSHLAERAAVGPQMLRAAITQLGPPSSLARSFVDDWQLSGALERGPSWRILLAMLQRVWRSLAAVVICTVTCVLYAFAVAFLIIAVMKPITPGNVGMWAGQNGGIGDFGVIFGTVHTTAELLGWWIIPIALVCAVFCYFAAALIMRGGGRLLLRPR